MLFDPEQGQMMRAIPMVRLPRLPGFPIAEGELAAWVAEANATTARAQPPVTGSPG
ncbi:hypothetical protein [Cellulomonas hominis]